MTPRWALKIGILLSLFTLGRMGLTLLRPGGALGMRPYGIMDNYYYADEIRRVKPQEPVWTNWPILYFIMGWPVPGDNFIAQINDGVEIDWNKPPYDKVKTRVYFRHSPISEDIGKGWAIESAQLTKGQFTIMEIWRRK